VTWQVRHFIAWMLHRVRGGAEPTKELTKKDAALFRSGGWERRKAAQSEGQKVTEHAPTSLDLT
jgi:hypothetical protein